MAGRLVVVVVAAAAAVAFATVAVRSARYRGPDDDDDDDRDDDDDEDGDEDGERPIVRAALRDEYRDMAPWYDSFWGSYSDATLESPLDVAFAALMLAASGRRRRRRRAASASASSACEGGGSSSAPAVPVLVVDVGCGTGTFLRRLADRLLLLDGGGGGAIAANLVGVEPSREMLVEARKKFDRGDDDHDDTDDDDDDDDDDGGGGAVRATFENSPAERLPLADGIADVVVSTSAFHFFGNRRRALSEMERVLVPGGTLIVVDWCADHFLVRAYHLLERLRWDYRWGLLSSPSSRMPPAADGDGDGGGDRGYPGPLTVDELRVLVASSGGGLRVTEHAAYRVRVFKIFPWGMQSIVATKETGRGGDGDVMMGTA